MKQGLARRGSPPSATPVQAAPEPEGWSWHWSREAGRLDAGQAAHLIQTQLELI